MSRWTRNKYFTIYYKSIKYPLNLQNILQKVSRYTDRKQMDQGSVSSGNTVTNTRNFIDSLVHAKCNIRTFHATRPFGRKCYETSMTI